MALPMRTDPVAVSPNEHGGPALSRGEPAGPPRPPRPRRRLWSAVAVALVAVVAAAAWLVLARDGGEATAEPVTPPATAQVEQRDLAEREELDGTLRFGEARAVAAGRGGTLTEVAEEGVPVARGEVLFRVDEVPVVLLTGTIPPYRTLSAGATGEDVRELETNLALLGFDADGTLTVDGSFDAATKAAVAAWQSDLGVSADGAVEPGDYEVAAGPVQVTAVTAAAGSVVTPETPVLEAAATSRTDAAVTPVAGAVTDLPEAGTVIEQGQVLFEVGGVALPVVHGDERFGRDLSEGTEGADVARLEQALAALGYDAEGELTVDQVYDGATREAVLAWEEALGITEDGVLQPAQALVVPAGATVGEVRVDGDDEVRAGEPVLEVTASTRVVVAELPLARAGGVAAGDAVEVELPGSAGVAGTVRSVGVVARVPEGDAEGDPVLEVEIDLDGALEGPAALLAEAPVEVFVAGEVAEGVLAVPTSALVALQGGGYAVEVVEGAQTRLVAVEPGRFADGLVEITGDVQAGDTVVVPR